MGSQSTGPSMRRGLRGWPWIVLAAAAAVLVGYVSDALGWPWWVRGLLTGACVSVCGSLAGRAWRRRREVSRLSGRPD